MAWSTSELAELAGTTVNTVRHYHRLGLLAEPERRYNGYKQYGVLDLVRLLRIRRLADLGIPLARIGAALEGGDTDDALSALDAELAESIRRLQQARDDIATIRREKAPIDSPPGFEAVARGLSAADSSIIHIYRRLYDADAMDDLRRMVAEDVTPAEVSAELDGLPADADDATRQRLAAALAPAIAQNLRDFPWLTDPVAHLSRDQRVTREIFVEAVVELYNPAQRDVLARASVLAGETLARERGADADG